jgi:hypothetical protein
VVVSVAPYISSFLAKMSASSRSKAAERSNRRQPPIKADFYLYREGFYQDKQTFQQI